MAERKEKGDGQFFISNIWLFSIDFFAYAAYAINSIKNCFAVFIWAALRRRPNFFVRLKKRYPLLKEKFRTPGGCTRICRGRIKRTNVCFAYTFKPVCGILENNR